MKIAVGGFQHETNTFASDVADYEEFLKHDAWPGLTAGDALFAALAGKNIPITGFVDAMHSGHELVPLLWCSAEPSSYVLRDAFERVTNELCDLLRKAGPVDAVYLDLHGAMVAEHYEDGEGETLARVRSVVGNDVPVIISLDFHANVTQKMVDNATAMTIFRTYPHLDMAETGARAARVMTHVLGGGEIHGRYMKVPFLLPLTSQCTSFDPNLRLFTDLRVREDNESAFLSIDFAEGFPPADIEECGPAVVAYADDPDVVNAQTQSYFDAVLAAEPDFENNLYPAEQAVALAVQSAHEGSTVVLADVQDNPGAGASSDTVGLLQALVDGGAEDAVMAILHDPEAVSEAHRLGVGTVFDIDLGGKSGQPGQQPYAATFEVTALGDGVFECFGAMYAGTTTNLGPMALLKIVNDKADVRVIVGSSRFQCLDLAIFRHLGVEPTTTQILAVKSSVHFRADFDPIAAHTILAEAPGSHPCRLVGLGYKNLRKGVRLEPMGPEH